jgi:hypothetical protein
MSGLVPVAEFGSKFEADAAVALLQSAGIPAVPSYDPAMNSVAPYFASDRTFEVLVRYYDSNRATEVLADSDDALPPEFDITWTPTTRASQVRSWTRWFVVVVLTLTVAVIVLTMLAGAFT